MCATWNEIDKNETGEEPEEEKEFLNSFMTLPNEVTKLTQLLIILLINLICNLVMICHKPLMVT